MVMERMDLKRYIRTYVDYKRVRSSIAGAFVYLAFEKWAGVNVDDYTQMLSMAFITDLLSFYKEELANG
ncbi:hypothetical protein NM688_g83 [Phlebia brevispora]|uniref:Uncharacterized protein n=1 Tax=Phlebia brevispora TaxID=194682 RepID=A0ACC1TFL0_9APHY|nr:hypothetical protein NM688_g83 [Phlebia brevispora]